MPNFAPPHKAGPRRNGLNLTFCCGGTAQPSNKRTMRRNSAQCRCWNRNSSPVRWCREAVRPSHRPVRRKRRRPEIRGASALQSSTLGRFGVYRLGLGFTVADRDLTRLFGLGDFAHKIDVQQSILEAGVLDLYMIGKLENALESTCGDTLIEYFAGLFFLDLLAAFDRQRVFFRLDRKLVFAEAGNSDGDAVVVLTGALDVVGRVARSR